MNENKKLFYTTLAIRNKPKQIKERMPTGFHTLDHEIIGLNKGEVSVVSGLNGSAKSTLLSQMALNMIAKGKRVALFSGELSEYRIMDWLHLQAAGKKYSKPTQWEKYFTVDDDICYKIDEWLEQRLFLYNNEIGKKTDQILSAVEDCILVKKVELVILDNLMSINLESNSYNKNDKQSEFIQSIVDFAKKLNVHIIIVAHPRKTIGFLRKDDIAGTADLTNAADNVFIVHRVNSDFKRLTKQTLFWKENDERYNFSNILEVCKNRDLGVMDLMVGLYYEKESKRMSCHQDNYETLPWQSTPPGSTKIEIQYEEEDNSLPFDL